MVKTKQWIIIRKFAYLKTPVYTWTCHNNIGGSFSNSAQYRGFNACANYVRTNYGNDVPINTYVIDGNGDEVFSSEMSNCPQMRMERGEDGSYVGDDVKAPC